MTQTKDGAPIVRTEDGVLSGKYTESGLLSFMGVPYAGSLRGSARFDPPGPVEEWDGVKDCSQAGPAAFQVSTGGHIGRRVVTERPQGAECLNLNIRITDVEPGKPVLVWFHGGGLFAGSNAEPALSTEAFASDGIVEVTVNYRLGLYGYMSAGDSTSPNRGLLDQIAALRWVQRNIHYFGGDASRVTIGGHSAGGFACAELLASPLAKGLFHQVILGSGAGSARHVHSTAEDVKHITFEALGIHNRAELDQLDDDALLAVQQQLIDECYTQMPSRFGQASILGLPYEHTIDDVSVVRDVAEILATGARRSIPVMVATTTGETVHHVSHFPDDLTLAEAGTAYEGMVRPLGTSGAETLHAYQKMMPGVSPKGLLAAVNADLRFTLDSIRDAAAQSDHAPVYRFVLGEESLTFGGLTPHGAIQGAAWRTPPGHQPQMKLKPHHKPLSPWSAEFVHSAVSSFIAEGTPCSTTDQGEFTWPMVSELQDNQVLTIRSEEHKICTDPAWQRLQWWGEETLNRSHQTA